MNLYRYGMGAMIGAAITLAVIAHWQQADQLSENSKLINEGSCPNCVVIEWLPTDQSWKVRQTPEKFGFQLFTNQNHYARMVNDSRTSIMVLPIP